MAKKTISQSLKDLFLGLGGDASALEDNTSASDYIQDLESAIKASASGAAEDLIDDAAASATTVYSSSKVESLIPENELPTPAVGDIGKVVSVVSDGESGAEYALETPSSGGGEFFNVGRVNLTNGSLNYVFPEGYERSQIFSDAITKPTILNISIFNINPMFGLDGKLTFDSFSDSDIYYRGVCKASTGGSGYYDVIFKFAATGASNDMMIYNEITTT